jgi:hypothetical protein
MVKTVKWKWLSECVFTVIFDIGKCQNFGCDFPLAAWIAIATNLKTIITR